jgi:hypothetical protein
MARNKQTARKSTRGPPHPIHHSQEVSDLEDDYYYYNHLNGGWVDTDTKEEPMELPEDHPEVSSGSNEGPAGGDGGDSGAADGDEDENGDDDSGAPGDDDDDPDDDPEPAAATNPPPPEPHYEKQILHLDSAEGPFPALLWRAMQRIGFPRKPRYEAHLFRNAQQEEEWLVAVVICVPDERPGCWVEYSKHIDEVPRRTLAAGTSEAAKRALYYLCHAYKDELQGTEFHQFPRRKRGATCAQIPAPPPGEGSLLMDTTQELVAALSTDLDAAGAEIQEVKKKLMKTIREKAILEARLRGDPVLSPEYDNDEPREYLPESPPRKRVHYGEPGYRTSYR